MTAGHCTTFLEQARLIQARVTFDPVFDDNATFYIGNVQTNPAYVPINTGSQSDPGDMGVIVFEKPISGIAPALLPTAHQLDHVGLQALHQSVFPTVGYGITRLLGGSNGGGHPDIDRTSAGTRMIATQSFFSLTGVWLRLSMLNDGRVCTGDSGAPNFLDDTNLVVAIGISGDFACEAMDAALRLDTPTARTFLSQFVALP